MSLRRGLANTTGLLLLALAIFYSSRYWPQQLPLLPVSNNPAGEAGKPDYFITDFHAIDLDDSGRIRYELTATRLEHFPQPEQANLTAPDMIFYRNNHADGDPVAVAPTDTPAATGAADGNGNAAGSPAEGAPATVKTSPWQLTAETGVVTDAGRRLDLAGKVRAARLTNTDADADGMSLETEKLTVYGARETARTDEPFVVRMAQAQLTGTGMDIDLKRGQINLHAQVRGHYDPQ